MKGTDLGIEALRRNPKKAKANTEKLTPIKTVVSN
jgi:hypothetical protein